MEEIRERLRAKEVEIAKHRKLLNRAVGNHILPYINYHHFEIVRLIGELDVIRRELDKAWHEQPLVQEIGKDFIRAYMKAEDEFLLTGTFPSPPFASSHISEPT